MTVPECPRETAVVQAIVTGAWPARAAEDLAAHAAPCPACQEAVVLAEALHDDSERARWDVLVPAAGQVWWRAAVRARLDTSHAATRPMTWMHGITAAVTLGLLLAALSAAWPMVLPAAERAWASVVPLFPSAEVAAALAGGLRLSLILGLAAAAFLVLAPLAVYFALSDD
jgi:hypothetical protein